MISKIKYKIDFSNGQSRSNDAELLNGSTMITGKNGRGKSLNLEMIAFTLFGTVALRGKTGDYSRIKSQINVTIKNTPYVIKRTKSGADVLNADGEPLATGHKAVNEWIISTLGYGYDVFRIAHWCAQGDIQALANMLPTQRKQMIDDVAGLTQMDGLIKLVGEEAKIYRAGITAAESVLIKPTEPVKPEGPSEGDLNIGLEQLEVERLEYLKLEAEVNSLPTLVEPVKPTEPHPLTLPKQPEELKVELLEIVPVTMPENLAGQDIFQVIRDLNERRRILEQRTQRLDHVKKLLAQTPQYIVSMIPDVALLTREELEQQHDLYKQATLKKELLEQGNVTCPNCNVPHPLASDALKSYDHIDLNVLQHKPLSFQDFERCLKWSELTAQAKELEAELQPLPTIVQLLEQFEPIAAQLNANENAEKTNAEKIAQQARSNEHNYRQWQNTCQSLKQSHDNSVAQFNANLENFAKACEAHKAEALRQEQIVSTWHQWGQDFKLDNQTSINEVNRSLQAWWTYHTLVEVYNKQLTSYELAKKSIDNDKALLEDRNKAKVALTEIKARVKTYIVPSLNQVASYLLSEMTGGEHSNVVIDENFEVDVDGQPLRTLSGSGKDITNLAIRIGLGRILTHKVLPVMMLDEIDAAMDEERAQYTWDCIQKITPRIGQVLQVSHKDLPAQHRMEVV